MDSREAYPRGAYAQGAPQPYSQSPAPGYYAAPSSDATDESEAGYPVYTGAPVIVVRERARRDHNPHRPSRSRPRAARP
jgi:hypothetical protein